MKKWIFFSSIFLANLPLFADDMPPGAEQSIWQTISMIGMFLIFFYFILFRPEQKRRKAAEEMRAQIQKGDRVTAMGIIGNVVRLEDDTVILKMYDGSKIQVLKGAITDIIPVSEEDAKKTKKIESINDE